MKGRTARHIVQHIIEHNLELQRRPTLAQVFVVRDQDNTEVDTRVPGHILAEILLLSVPCVA